MIRAADFPVISQGLTQCLIPLAAKEFSILDKINKKKGLMILNH